YEHVAHEVRDVAGTLATEISRLDAQSLSVRLIETLVGLSADAYTSATIALLDAGLLIDRVHSRLADHERSKTKDPLALATVDDAAIRTLVGKLEDLSSRTQEIEKAMPIVLERLARHVHAAAILARQIWCRDQSVVLSVHRANVES